MSQRKHPGDESEGEAGITFGTGRILGGKCNTSKRKWGRCIHNLSAGQGERRSRRIRRRPFDLGLVEKVPVQCDETYSLT